jgi:hypothetical protein
VVYLPMGWWHWEIATKDHTHLLAIFHNSAPQTVFGSDVLRKTPPEVFQLNYCINVEQLAQVLEPIKETVVIDPPYPGCLIPQAITNMAGAAGRASTASMTNVASRASMAGRASMASRANVAGTAGRASRANVASMAGRASMASRASMTGAVSTIGKAATNQGVLQWRIGGIIRKHKLFWTVKSFVCLRKQQILIKSGICCFS